MITDKELEFEKNEEGCMVDEDGDNVYCDSDCCEAEAMYRAVVSVEGPHDETRNYCSVCYEAYMIGVQHGRCHEAALHGTKPGRDSSQDQPTSKGR